MKRIIMGPFPVLLFLISVTNRLHSEAASVSGVVPITTTEPTPTTTGMMIIADSGSVSNEVINISINSNITDDNNNPSSSPAPITSGTTTAIATSSELPPPSSSPVIQPVSATDNRNEDEVRLSSKPKKKDHEGEDDDDDRDENEEDDDHDHDDDDDHDHDTKVDTKEKKIGHSSKSSAFSITEVIIDGNNIAQRSTNLSDSSSSTKRPCPLKEHSVATSVGGVSNQGKGKDNGTFVVKNELSPGTALEKISESLVGVMSTIKNSVTSIFSPGAGLPTEHGRNEEVECHRNHSSNNTSNSTLEIITVHPHGEVANSTASLKVESVEETQPVGLEDAVVMETTTTFVLPATNETVVSDNITTTTSTSTTTSTPIPTTVDVTAKPEATEVAGGRQGRKFKSKGGGGGGGGFFNFMGFGGKKDKDKKKNKNFFGF